MMTRLIRRGDFVIRIEGERAKVYDRKSRKKLFDGSIEDVFRDLNAKIEGEVVKAGRRRYI